ncbi:MAG: FAD-dependent oxidoreductase, partial [Planctomycetaceae bacterium]|nr:FAD-dependent oxidoreductase [Planctomycetaceae bacterium]
MRHCDLCVIGSGPGGQRAAIQAAKLGRDVVVIEKMDVVGGVAINTGTIPSKAMREGVVAVTGAQHMLPMANDALMSREVQLSVLSDVCSNVVRAEVELVRKQLLSNGVTIISGHGSFVSPSVVQADGPRGVETISAENILIAVGTTPAKQPGVDFDGRTIITSDEILKLKKLPRSMIVVGGGVIGTEYASMLAALGVKVTIIEGHNRLLDFIDPELGESLQYHLRKNDCSLRLGEKVVSIPRVRAPVNGRYNDEHLAEATLESGKT